MKSNRTQIKAVPLPAAEGKLARRNFIHVRASLLSLLALIPTLAQGAVPPWAFTQPPTEIHPTSAKLNGMATPNGLPSWAWFQWGERGGYDHTTLPVFVGDGTVVRYLNAVITNLAVRGSYQCRLVVSNASGVVFGAPRLCTTGGKVVAWGENEDGQCSLPPGLTNVVAMTGGWDSSFALRSDGSLTAWGGGYGGAKEFPPDLTNVAALATGGGHSLALKPDGTIVAWGYNGSGQTNVPSDLTNVVAVACGNEHSMALKADGTVVAWGDYLDGQTNVPVDLSNVVAVAGNVSQSLALKADGTVVAWGTDDPWNPTVVPPGLSEVVDVQARAWRSIALKADGTVTMWGRGLGSPPNWSNVLAVSYGGSHVLGLAADGTVAAWGYWDSSSFAMPSDLTNVVAVASGGDHSLAIVFNTPPHATPQDISGPPQLDTVITLSGSDANNDGLAFRITSLPTVGTLYQCADGVRGLAITAPDTWVSDPLRRVILVLATNEFASPSASFSFRINDGDTDSFPATVTMLVERPLAFTQAAREIRPTSAVLQGMATPKNGLPTAAWFEWGVRGAYSQTTAPVNVGTGSSVVLVRSAIAGLTARGVYQCRLVVSNAAGVVYGAAHVFTTGDKVAMWGANYYGQSTVPAGLSDAVTGAFGFDHTLAVRADGTVISWGDHESGQVPAPAELSNVVMVAAAQDYSLALNADGTITGWGKGTWGADHPPPGLSNVIAVACYDIHSLALRENGTVVAWGVPSMTNVPTGLTNVVAIASGYAHNVALKADGTVAVWTTWLDDSPVTAVPAGLSNVVAVVAGCDYTLALKSDGSLVAWGWASCGPCSIPAGLSNVVAVVSAAYHSMAMTLDGTLTVWGLNYSGVTNVPPNLTNVSSLVSGSGSSTMVIAPNLAPQAVEQTLTALVNRDHVVALNGADLNGDVLRFRISSLPSQGRLFQYADGVRGASIEAPDTLVSDPAGRIVFAPETNAWGSPPASFSFVANDSESDSAPAVVTIAVVLPPPPRWTGWSRPTGTGFELRLGGGTNALYSVWASSNLFDWQRLGTPEETAAGVFRFVDLSASNQPRRFYRVGAP
ncbi:MAG: hypothetical protein HZA90_05565 [Verrucomicrobia bacterium]|nr:hypothetical protein [Verrucomicrobiota bacterium]